MNRPIVRQRDAQPIGHTAYHHIGHTAYHHIGADPTAAATPATATNPPSPITSESSFWQWVRVGVIGLAAFHGYRRNNSVGWAVGWALLAGISPPITIGVAVAQGFGARKGS